MAERKPVSSALRWYKNIIERNFSAPGSGVTDFGYWQNRLFSLIMMYLFPLSLIAVFPGVIMSFVGGIYPLGVFDAFVFGCLWFICFNRRLSIKQRKTIFIVVLYLTAIMLLVYLGSYGPGLLYLLAITIFAILIFPKEVAYFTVIINTVLCINIGFLLASDVMHLPLLEQYTIGSWIAVSSNLILLCTIVAALVPTIFKGMQSTIHELNHLRLQLSVEQGMLKQSLETVKTKNSELEAFAYTASHDLQEPLRMVTGFLTQLDKNYGSQLDEKGRNYIYHAGSGASRMKQTIADLLDFSTAGKKEMNVEWVNLQTLVEEFIADHKMLIDEKKGLISAHDLPTIKGNKTLLSLLLQNIIGNGLTYQKPGAIPAIHIDYSETPRNWQINIRDNGIGISPEDQEKIFIVFQRLHEKTEYPGTGIGLATCKKIVENHKGRIWVDSTKDKGSTFSFTISKHI